jgi:nucleoside phosphorylase
VAATTKAVIFTALDIETDAVAAHLAGVAPVRCGEAIYQRGSFAEGIGWDVFVVQTGPENQIAATEVESAIGALGPVAAVFVGVAGGFAEKGVARLDVVVPGHVEYYQAGSAGEEFRPRHRQHHPTRYFLQAARQIGRNDAWLERIKGATDPTPKVWLEPLASGDHVVKSLDSVSYRHIRNMYDQVVAVDMEASGFLTAAGLHHELQHLVVRGISDLLSDKDLERDKTLQPEAAARAAAFAFAVLASTPQEMVSNRAVGIEPVAWEPVATQSNGPGEQGGSSKAPSSSPSTTTVARLGRHLADILDLDSWHRKTEGIFFGSPPDIAVEFDERLVEAVAWVGSRVPIAGAESVLDAMYNLESVIRDFRDVFHQKAELMDSHRRYRVEQFYRQYNKPISVREQLLEEFSMHVLLIKDLGAEMTRAVNLIGERIRSGHDPDYRVVEGAAGIYVGPDESFMVVTYTDDEREQARPYPGLPGFAEILSSRDGSFGPYRPLIEDWPETALEHLSAALALGDLVEASTAAFRFAALVAGALPVGEEVVLPAAVGREHQVYLCVVSVRWKAADGRTVGEPVNHLLRTYVTPRGEPHIERQGLIGSPSLGAAGEVLSPTGAELVNCMSHDQLRHVGTEGPSLLAWFESRDP